MPKVTPRDISPILQQLRNILLGRQHITALRFEKDVASRSPQQPELPDGPCHKIHANGYHARDVRREVMPPSLIASNKKAIAEAAVKDKKPKDKKRKLPRPGKVHLWD